jgi:hypothetical protein
MFALLQMSRFLLQSRRFLLQLPILLGSCSPRLSRSAPIASYDAFLIEYIRVLSPVIGFLERARPNSRVLL